MSQISKLIKSRDEWKIKAKERGAEVRRCHKAMNRYKVQINRQKLLIDKHGIEDPVIQSNKKNSHKPC